MKEQQRPIDAPMLKTLSNDQLIHEAKTLACEERQLTAHLLEYLGEIRARGLHLKRGHPSLFQFCIDTLGFTESQAHARISAMKLSQELPEVVQKVANGELSLTNAAAAQVFFRQKNRVGKAYSKEEKQELVSSLQGLSTRQCERKLAELSPEAPPLERERPISAHQTELKIIADEELMQDLQRLKELWSHSLKDGTYAELIQKMAKLSLAKADKARAPHSPKIGAPRLRESHAVNSEDHPPLGIRITRQRSRHIPRAIARAVWQRDQGRCAYIDPITGKSCGSKHRLQLDHIQAFAQGGKHTQQNLRLACQAHNLFRAARSYAPARPVSRH